MEQNKDQIGAAVRGEAVAAARAVLEEKWDAEGACESCGWHASLGEHHVDDEDIAEAMLFGCKLKLSCLSKDDDTRDSHRGVAIDISARAADAPSEPSALTELDLAELEYVAKKADEIVTDLYGDRYMQRSWSRVDLDKEQDDFIAAFKPATVLALIAAVKSRAADALDSQPTSITLSFDLAKLEALARAAGGAKFQKEGFEQAHGNGTFYGGLIMHENGETIVAQCVLNPWADFIEEANPANVLELTSLARRQAAMEAVIYDWKRWAFSASLDERNGDLCKMIKDLEASSQPTDGGVRNG